MLSSLEHLALKAKPKQLAVPPMAVQIPPMAVAVVTLHSSPLSEQSWEFSVFFFSLPGKRKSEFFESGSCHFEPKL